MASFSGLNTYAAGKSELHSLGESANDFVEVRPVYRTAVITGKYVVQYSFAAGSVGGVVPLINSLGVGWAFTICEHFIIDRDLEHVLI